MLTMKRAQVEQALRAEETRLRHIESRIEQIDRQGRIEGCDVVVECGRGLRFCLPRRTFEDMDEVVPVIRTISEEAPDRSLQSCVTSSLSSRATMSRTRSSTSRSASPLPRRSNVSMRISDSFILLMNELPAVPTMATIVRSGTNAASHSSFAAIGTWIEANKYEIAGPCPRSLSRTDHRAARL